MKEQKQSSDIKLFEKMQSIINLEFKKRPVNKHLLANLFRMSTGDIFFNEEYKIAIGFVSYHKSLVFHFFEMDSDETLKHLMQRSITISDYTANALQKAITACLLSTEESGDADDMTYG